MACAGKPRGLSLARLAHLLSEMQFNGAPLTPQMVCRLTLFDPASKAHLTMDLVVVGLKDHDMLQNLACLLCAEDFVRAPGRREALEVVCTCVDVCLPSVDARVAQGIARSIAFEKLSPQDRVRISRAALKHDDVQPFHVIEEIGGEELAAVLRRDFPGLSNEKDPEGPEVFNFRISDGARFVGTFVESALGMHAKEFFARVGAPQQSCTVFAYVERACLDWGPATAEIRQNIAAFFVSPKALSTGHGWHARQIAEAFSQVGGKSAIFVAPLETATRAGWLADQGPFFAEALREFLGSRKQDKLPDVFGLAEVCGLGLDSYDNRALDAWLSEQGFPNNCPLRPAEEAPLTVSSRFAARIELASRFNELDYTTQNSIRDNVGVRSPPGESSGDFIRRLESHGLEAGFVGAIERSNPPLPALLRAALAWRASPST